MKFDELDKRIMDVLTIDARTSNREAARIIGVSETAVRKRLRRLERLGAAQISAVVNPVALGLKVSAFLRLTTTPASAREIAAALAAMEDVSFVGLTTGRFNVIALVTTTSREELAALVHDQLRCREGIVLVETSEILSNTKHRFDLVWQVRSAEPVSSSNDC